MRADGKISFEKLCAAVDNADSSQDVRLITDNCLLIAARDQPPRAAVMRRKLNVVRRQRGFHAPAARGMKRSLCCALLRPGGVRTWEEDLEYPRPRERSVN